MMPTKTDKAGRYPSLEYDSRRTHPHLYNAGRLAFLRHGEAGEDLAPPAGDGRTHWLVGFYDARTASRVSCVPDPGEAPVDGCGR